MRLSKARRAMAVALLGAFVAVAGAQPPATPGLKRFTIDELFDPDRKVEFSGTPPTGLTWIDDAHYHWPKTDPKTRLTEHLRVEALTGRAEPLFEADALQAHLERQAIAKDEARKLARQRSYVMDAGRTALLVSAGGDGGDLFLFQLASRALRRLTRTSGEEEVATFSPDGTTIAFVRGGNLHVVSRAGDRERALTRDGSPDVLNGKLDWVYQEEVYGRGHFLAHWWSPDSKHLAFLQLREAKVPRFPVVDDIPYQPTLEQERYPKAGDVNPEVRLGIVRSGGGGVRWVDLSQWAADEPLIVGLDWTPDGRSVLFRVQDRIQSWLDLAKVGPEGGRPRVLFRDRTRAWIDPGEVDLKFLADGGFLWTSERTGWKHIYRYRGDGTLVGPVTSGEWEARTLHGIDEKGGWVHFSGTERSPIATDVYRVRLDGSGLERLSRTPGAHTASFNGSFGLFIDTWSDVSTPPQVRLHRADGSEARVIDANDVRVLRDYALGRPELVQVPTRDGFVMEALIVKPPDFDPTRRYPVYQHTYGGPHAPQVRNAWGGTTYLFHQMLAQRGVVVWICDNRTASGKGAVSAWPLYKRFGELELRDIEDGLDWLTRQPWIDSTRIGISGWSYGGFMVSYALTHSRRFAMGIAGGSVTDWRDYDSIYTERYMTLPRTNAEGYKKASPRWDAKDLHGRLLLIHGAIDDNVHPQNTLQFAHELQKAGRPFRLMLYPKSRHGVTDPALAKHLRALMLAWVEETLLSRPADDWPIAPASPEASPTPPPSR